jgi:hypothetical protein
MKKNKNLSPSYEKSYLQVAEPSLGATVPKSKRDRVADNRESGKAYPGAQTPEQVRTAAENVGSVRAAHEAQNGKNHDNQPHPQSGCSTDDE